GSPFETEIGTGKVIKGWDEGVPQLSLGERAILTATPDYVRIPPSPSLLSAFRVASRSPHFFPQSQAYGARGFPPVIPPNSTLRFEVELLKIN
ncbi:hypothetical protein EW146_g2250, partial [Bondarzewia mesenterica]